MERESTLTSLLKLGLPVIAEEILGTLMQYVDTAMVGRLGEKATASVSLTSSIGWLTGGIFSAFSVALMSMISKSYGERDYDKMRSLARLSERWVLITSLPVMAISLGVAKYIPIWMKADPSIHSDATLYFAIISIPMVFRSSMRIFSSAIRAVKDAVSPMLINAFSNLVNIALNWLFIYRLSYGVMGAAIASAISFTLSGTLMFLRFRNIRELKHSFRTPIKKGLTKEMLSIATPTLGTTIFSSSGYIVFASLVSSMGTVIFASHEIAIQAEEIFYIPGFALRSATQTLIGISYGERDIKRFNETKRYSIILTLITMTISGGILYLVSDSIMGIFTPNQDVISLGGEMLRIVSLTEPFFGLMIVMEGIYWGLGKTKYTFFVETLSMWGIRILSTYIVVNVLHGTLGEVWYAMVADNIAKAVLLTLPMLFKRGLRLDLDKETMPNPPKP